MKKSLKILVKKVSVVINSYICIIKSQQSYSGVVSIWNTEIVEKNQFSKTVKKGNSYKKFLISKSI